LSGEDYNGDRHLSMNQNSYCLLLPNAEVTLHPSLFSQQESHDIFFKLYSEIAWEQHLIKIFGKTLLEPRLSAYYGDKPYHYSGSTREPLPWLSVLKVIKARIEPLAGVTFNAVFLNLYRDGNDGVGWHSDDEKDMGKNPVIGSVSFGATRRFMLKRRDRQKISHSLDLSDGDLLVMAGETQHFWHHQIPKVSPKKASLIQPRINLTYRVIL
jgi:alkylated DNA repair dioxygenase AlkB